MAKRKYNARPCMRQRIWRAMRIMGKFTVPSLMTAIEGATYGNVQSYVSRLFKAGYLRKFGTVRRGYSGEYQGYILVKDDGPTMPVLLAGRHENKKEKEKEKETATAPAVEGAEEINHDAV